MRNNIGDHDAVIRAFMSEHPTWQRTGLRRQLNQALGKDAEKIAMLGFIPDAFEIDPPYVRLLEVAGHSYIDNTKTQLITGFWAELDDRSWSCELYLINLFVGTQNVLTDRDLMRLYLDCRLVA